MTRKSIFDEPTTLKERLEDLWLEITKYPRRTKYWFLERFTRTKIIVDTLHGGWWDTDGKILHANFQLLTDFVEKELAGMYDVCNLSNYGSPLVHTGREKGEAYLLHEDAEDKDSNEQYYVERRKINAKILELYRWWKDVYPKRDSWAEYHAWKETEGKDFEAWSFACRDEHGASVMEFNESHELYKKHSELMSSHHKIEQAYEEEDTRMLIDLINIRQCLWT